MILLLLLAWMLLPNPPKPAMWACTGCGAKNEDFRYTCRNCGGGR
ncbi:hypothetical protein AB0J63_26865 [Streptosporangium canum]